ncbi:MAG: putative baseplate assembly protein [ANME-2 cluster archaeon]|nr:putative baseplate assembly protein [ANME-2 cluster archaeon]
MALKVPQLDERKYESILEDTKKQIPIYTRDWTDHNIHDPGITFLELLVWLAEMQVYHLDQITSKHYVKFLKLMGFTPRHQRCALVDITIVPKSVEGIIISGGEQIIATDESGDKRVFETTETLAVSQAKITRVLCDHPGGREDNTEANNKAGIYYLAFGTKAEIGSCMYIGFDRSHSPFNPTIHILDIVIEYYEDNLPSPASHGDEIEDISVSVEVVWQYCINYDEWYRDDSWVDFELQKDSTLMLTRKGKVGLKRPATWQKTPGRIFTDEESYFWIRCKVVRDGYEIPPQIDIVMINTVTALQKVTIENEILERSDDLEINTIVSTGLPYQIFYFSHPSIIYARIVVDEEKWTEVGDLDGSGPDDPHYILERDEGKIVFGNGIHGKNPPSGSQVKAEVYCYGGGTEGNIKPNSAWEFNREVYSRSEFSLNNKFKATGGTDEETFSSALVRLKKDLKVPWRGITLEDYEYIAIHTPGLRFGRSKALVCEGSLSSRMDLHSIRVIVVPFSTKAKPEPSQGFIDTVLRHLNRHRLLTDKIEVIGPNYVGIGVKISVYIEPGYSEEGRKNTIIEALNDFLDPLKGGEDGKGWPFGRTVYRSEIYSLIENVEGVDCVRSVDLGSAQKKVNDLGNIDVDEDTLVYSTSHHVTIMTREEKCMSGV